MPFFPLTSSLWDYDQKVFVLKPSGLWCISWYFRISITIIIGRVSKALKNSQSIFETSLSRRALLALNRAAKTHQSHRLSAVALACSKHKQICLASNEIILKSLCGNQFGLHLTYPPVNSLTSTFRFLLPKYYRQTDKLRNTTKLAKISFVNPFSGEYIYQSTVYS